MRADDPKPRLPGSVCNSQLQALLTQCTCSELPPTSISKVRQIGEWKIAVPVSMSLANSS